jgi:hypothetical protein
LVVGDLGLVVVAYSCEEVAGEVEAVARSQKLVVGIGEMDLDLPREELVMVEFHSVVQHRSRRVSGRFENAPHTEDGVSQDRDALPDRDGGPGLDEVLQVVDALVEAVDQRQELFRDFVDYEVQPHPGRSARAQRADAKLLTGKRTTTCRCLADGDETVPGDEHINFPVEDPMIPAGLNRDYEHAEDVIAMTLQTGSQHAAGLRHSQQTRQRCGVDLLWDHRRRRRLIRV